MPAFKVSEPFTVQMILLIPTYASETKDFNGVPVKNFPSLQNGIAINGNFKTYGGTERAINGLYSVEDTAWIETWYRPDIKADCRIAVPVTGAVYEIVGEPENINLRNQYLKIRVRRVAGGA